MSFIPSLCSMPATYRAGHFATFKAFKTWVCRKLRIEFGDTYFESLTNGAPIRSRDHMPFPAVFRLVVRSDNITSVVHTVHIVASARPMLFIRVIIT